MLAPTYPILTPRLAIRPFTVADVDAAHAYLRLPEVTRYLYWEPRDRAAAAEAVATKTTHIALREPGERLTLAVDWRETGELAGECNLLWLSRENRQGEIGYVLNPAFHGRGIATEAAGELLRLGFDGLGLHRIVARCDARNTASARVMERLGMRLEAHFVHDEIFKGEWGDSLVYAILDSEWRPRSGAPIGAGSTTVSSEPGIAGGAERPV